MWEETERATSIAPGSRATQWSIALLLLGSTVKSWEVPNWPSSARIFLPPCPLSSFSRWNRGTTKCFKGSLTWHSGTDRIPQCFGTSRQERRRSHAANVFALFEAVGVLDTRRHTPTRLEPGCRPNWCTGTGGRHPVSTHRELMNFREYLGLYGCVCWE